MSSIKIKQIDGLEDVLFDKNSIRHTFIQNNHNFQPGDAVSYYLDNWALAELNDDNLARIIVESIVDQNNFVGVLEGFIQVNDWGLDPGSYYFLSATTPGAITNIEESEEFSNILLQALSSTTAHVLSWRPSKSNDSGDLINSQSDRELTQEEISFVTNGNFSSTGIALTFKNTNNSTIQVYINSVAIIESYGNRLGEVYFSADGGITAKTVSEIDVGDILYWNGDIAGYNLDANDKISIVYHSLGDNVGITELFSGDCYEFQLLSSSTDSDPTEFNYYEFPSGNFNSLTLTSSEPNSFGFRLSNDLIINAYEIPGVTKVFGNGIIIDNGICSIESSEEPCTPFTGSAIIQQTDSTTTTTTTTTDAPSSGDSGTE